MFYSTIFDEKTKTWKGLPKVPKYNANVSVGQVVLEALSREPNKIGQVNKSFELYNPINVFFNNKTKIKK